MLRLHHTTNFAEIRSFSTAFRCRNTNRRASPTRIARDSHITSPKSRRFSSFLVVCAVEKDSEFEVDPVKAREALRKLDEELKSISQRQLDPPKIRASDLDQARRQVTEESFEISGSFLTNLAIGLVIFTIFYNILFLTVIKPAIDIPDDMEYDSTMIQAN